MPRIQPTNQDVAGDDWALVQVPVGAAGVDLRDGRALRPPTALRELNNAQFLSNAEIRKRNGHSADRVTANAPLPALPQEEVTDRSWLFGWGDWSPGNADQALSNEPILWPNATQLRGAFTLNDVLGVTTGDRILTRTEDEPRWAGGSRYWRGASASVERGIPAYVPFVDADPVDIGSYRIQATDAVAGEHYEVVALAASGSPHITFQIKEASSGTHLTRAATVTGANNFSNTLKMVHSAGAFVALWNDTSNQLWFSFAAESDVRTWSTPAQWASGQRFDVETISDDRFLVLWRDTNDLKIAYWRGGTRESSPAGVGTVLNPDGETAVGVLGVAVHNNGTICAVWESATGAHTRMYTAGGAAIDARLNLDLNPPSSVTATALWHPYPSGGSPAQFTVYGTFQIGGMDCVKSANRRNGAIFARHTYAWCRLSTRAFRIGCEPAVVMHSVPDTGTVQSSHHLVIGNGEGTIWPGRIAGCWSRGGAPAFFSSGDASLTSVRPLPGQGYNIEPTTRRWFGSVVSCRLTPSEITSLFPVVNRYDFLPPVRWAQFNNEVYFAGSAVQSFDGVDCVEAGFLTYPEVKSVASANVVGGGLAVGDIRSYRVYAVHRNAFGEVTRSPALSFTASAVGGGHNSNNVTFTALPLTNRYGAWFEVYATEGSASGPGATFYLASAGNAVFAPQNHFTFTGTVVFNDFMSNAALISRPADPFTAPTGQAHEIENAAPPGCSVIASGRNRLFFAGGELPDGRIAHSKLRDPSTTAGWDDEAGYIDVTTGAIVSIGAVGESLVVFTANEVLLVGGDGPDNRGFGAYQTAEVVAGAAGAAIHEGTALTELGLVYWSKAGPRLVSNSGGVVDISREVEPLAKELTASVVACVPVPRLREVRWYTSTGRALLWDHSPGSAPRWATWSGLPAAGAVRKPDGLVAVALNDLSGLVLLENEEPSTDGGRHYEYSWHTGEIGTGGPAQSNNEARRVAVIGDYRGPHTLRCWVHYDGSPMWRDNFTFDPEDQIAVQGWGTGNGVWNTDDSAWIDPAMPSPDGVYRYRRRLLQQPCGTVSFRFSDGGAPNDTVHISEVAVEMAAGPGATRTPPRNFGGPPVTEEGSHA